MATYADLTQADKDKLDYFTTILRASSGEFAQTLQKIGAIKDYYVANELDTVMGTIDADELIPNKTGLAGAVDMEQQETMVLIANLNSALIAYDVESQRLIRVKAAGINASL